MGGSSVSLATCASTTAHTLPKGKTTQWDRELLESGKTAFAQV